MRKRFLVFGIILLFICMNFNPSFAFYNPVSSGNTLYVGGSGEGNYSNIKDAINASSPGDTIFVYNGTYYEDEVDIDKSNITILGENKNTTIIDGGGSFQTIRIWSVKGGKISGFTIRNCSNWHSNSRTIHLADVDNYEISDNIITATRVDSGAQAIMLIGCSYITIANNSISESTAGIILTYSLVKDSVYNLISGNIFYNNNVGISIGHGSDHTAKNIISENIFYENNYGIYDYDGFWESRIKTLKNRNIIRNNDFYKNNSVQATFFEQPMLFEMFFAMFITGKGISYATNWTENYWETTETRLHKIYGYFPGLGLYGTTPAVAFDLHPKNTPNRPLK